jgi:hypothetical protein
MQLTEPTWILVEFLRARITDPKGRHTETTESQNGTGSKTVFTLTPPSGNVQCMNSVTVGGTAQYKYKDYTMDLYAKTITFTTAPDAGTNNVVFNYDYGSKSWIYPDMPMETLASTAFPRISVTEIGTSGRGAGLGETRTLDNIRFQIDVWTMNNIAATVAGEANIANMILVQYYARAVWKTIRDYWTDIMYADMHRPNLVNKFDHPYDENTQMFRTTLEVEMIGENIGG